MTWIVRLSDLPGMFSQNIFSDAFSSPVLIESNDEAFITSLGNGSIIRTGLLLILSYNLPLFTPFHHPPNPVRNYLPPHWSWPFPMWKTLLLMDLKIK